MAYYVALNTAAVTIQGAREAEVKALTLEQEAGLVLPVFTSAERFWGFFGRAPGEAGRIHPLATYPFGLAEMVARVGAKGKIEALVFDPVPTAPEGWRSAREPIRVGAFVRFAEEIRPGVEKLAAEHAANYGPAPLGSEAFAKARRERAPQIEKISEEAKARMSEWEV